MSDFEPIAFRSPSASASSGSMSSSSGRTHASVVTFDRRELSDILAVYGRRVATGEWRDYAIDMTADKAVFSIFRKSSECPLYRIEKNPRLARRQGAYSIVTATGLILKRGQDLNRVLAAIDKRLQVVSR
jgi:Protein of unknown function (DUF2794)